MIAAANETLAARLQDNRRLALRLVPVSRETEERFTAFVDLIARWRKATNLISESTFASVWTRHIADCAQLIALAPAATRWVDMGSGAGFPGIVIAIQLAGIPGAVVHCIESDQRKCAFLREAVRATGAVAAIRPQRVEAIEPARLEPVDAVTARAFAPLSRTLELATPWIMRGAVGVFPRGESAKDQLAALSQASAYEIEALPSVVETKATILRVRMNVRAEAP
jgi:16S rRNA (guanine527-N7)-methyltransferase